MSTEPRGECVTQSDGGQVDIGCLGERLVASPGISNHQKSRLLEGLLDLVSEGDRGEVSSKQWEWLQWQQQTSAQLAGPCSWTA